jgi:hypothetical protein
MQRRKYLAALGSLAAGGAAIGGTGAFSIVRADRSLNATTAGDSAAYLGFDPSTSVYATGGGSQMTLQFNGANGGQNGSGLNRNADSRFDNVFRIVNQGTNPISVEVADDPNTIGFASDSPLTLFHSDGPSDEVAPGFSDENGDPFYAFPNTPNPEGEFNYGPDSKLLTLDVGADAYIHMNFYLRDSNITDGTNKSINTSPSAIPDLLGFYAQGNSLSNGSGYSSP